MSNRKLEITQFSARFTRHSLHFATILRHPLLQFRTLPDSDVTLQVRYHRRDVAFVHGRGDVTGFSRCSQWCIRCVTTLRVCIKNDCRWCLVRHGCRGGHLSDLNRRRSWLLKVVLQDLLVGCRELARRFHANFIRP